jgi:hypothetical protein
MTILVPRTGERFEAEVIADERGVLHLIARHVDDRLAAVPKIRWRIVETTPAERALLEAHGFGSGRVQ